MASLDIDTAEDLRRQLTEPSPHPGAELRLRQITGVGPKTVDYLRLLAGSTDTVAIDTHLIGFAMNAGVRNLSYSYLKQVYLRSAVLRSWQAGSIDAAVWSYMSDNTQA
jgi:hypothetical protein